MHIPNLLFVKTKPLLRHEHLLFKILAKPSAAVRNPGRSCANAALSLQSGVFRGTATDIELLQAAARDLDVGVQQQAEQRRQRGGRACDVARGAVCAGGRGRSGQRRSEDEERARTLLRELRL